MGLAERRAIEALKNEFISWEIGHKSRFPQIEVVVDFDKLQSHENVVQISEAKWMTDRILNRVTNVLNEIAQSQIGADALATNLKKIVILPYAGEKYFHDRTLTIESSPYISEGAWAEPEIIRFLEENL